MQIILINGARKQEFNHLGIFGRLQNNLDFCPSMQWDCELTDAVLCNITKLSICLISHGFWVIEWEPIQGI